METLTVLETKAGWIVWDEDYQEELSIPFIDRSSAEVELDNVRTNRAERAYERYLEDFYG